MLLVSSNGINTSCFCGVMARGKEQFTPILDSLPGKVVAYNAVGSTYRSDILIYRAVQNLMDQPADRHFWFIGASLGGDEVPFVVRRFRRSRPDVDPKNIHAVMVDAPAGLESLKDPMAKFMQYRAIAQIAGTVTSLVNVPVGDNVLPKPDDITVPSEFSSDPDAYKSSIIDAARGYMSGYKLGLLARQSNRMIRIVKDGSLEEACKSLIGTDVYYVICERGNDVVEQPMAYRWVKDRVLNLIDVPVSGTHCGFLQNAPEFNDAFRWIVNHSNH